MGSGLGLRQMWGKLIGLATIEAALVWWLTKPIQTHAVIYDPTLAPLDDPFMPITTQFIIYAAILAVVLIPWLAYRVISRSSQP
jgi:hypothetical protein